MLSSCNRFHKLCAQWKTAAD